MQYELYDSVASDLAAAADLGALYPCEGTDAECADGFIAEFGMKVYRRPLDVDAMTRLKAVYDVGAADGDHERGLRLALRTMLQSPNFLYHPETTNLEAAAPGAVVPLDGFERASRLSYLVWSSGPDDELLQAALAGELDTAAGMAAQTARLLQDDRAKGSMISFYDEWLELKLDGLVIDGLDVTVPAQMKEETERFVSHVLFESTGTLRELLTADYSFVNAPLAEIYGVAAVDDWTQVDLDPTERRGVLTHPSFLAHTASEGSAAPVFRGKFVREQLFCQLLPEPPDDIPPISEAGTEADSLRERLAAHREEPGCRGCHELMDPLGFPFEVFDSQGRYRTLNPNGTPVDALGSVTGTSGDDVDVDGPLELIDYLAESEDVRQCMSNQWLRYALQRLEGGDDLCSLRVMDEAFSDAGYDLNSLVTAVVQTDAFLYRRLGEEAGQ